MKLMKMAMAGVAVLTLCTSLASAQNSGRRARLWQPDILRSGFFANQDGEVPAPPAATLQPGQSQLPEGSFLVEGDAHARTLSYGSAGCGCAQDSCSSCDRGCDLFGWLRLGRRHNSCGGCADSCNSCSGHGFSLFKHNWFDSGCNSCCEAPVSCCAPRKSFRLFSGNWFGRNNCATQTACCDPAPACDPCNDRGWLDKFLSCNTDRGCNYAPSCCEPAPACDSGCDSGCGLNLFSWFKRGHGHSCGCDSCGSSYASCGCGAAHGNAHYHEHQQAVPSAPAIPGMPAPPANVLPPGVLPDHSQGNAA